MKGPFTAEHERLRDEVRRFVASELHPHADVWERRGRLPRRALTACAARGWFSLDPWGQAVLAEELPRCDSLGLALSVFVQANLIAPMLRELGSPAQQRAWLEPLVRGHALGALAVSEPDAGSDVAALQTTGERRGTSLVLDGTKTFVTNAPVADLIVAYATVDPALGPLGVTSFVVERGRRGVAVGKPIEKMGLRTSPMAEVVFDGVEVPATHRLGREGRGVEVFESSMEWERGCILASCLGVMRRQLERCVAHARTRRQFGQPIGKFQAVASRIVDMQLRLETSRLLVYRLGAKKDRGEDATAEAALAKLHVSDSFVKSGLDAVQVFGGYGYTAEYELERELRDAIGGTLYSGTSEIQRNILSRALGL